MGLKIKKSNLKDKLITAGLYIAMSGLGIGSAVGSAVSFTYAAIIVYDQYSSAQPQAIQRDVIGDERPETYIENNGIRYYSHIDGREVSDLVNE